METFFEERKISGGTLERFKVQMASQVYCPALNKKVDAIAFPYYRNKELVNVKYRALPKIFWQVRSERNGFFDIALVVRCPLCRSREWCLSKIVGASPRVECELSSGVWFWGAKCLANEVNFSCTQN
jgi:hypothetical protein